MLRNSWAAGEMRLAMVRAPPRSWDGRDRMCLPGNQRAFQVVTVARGWTDAGAPGADRPSHGLGRHPGNAKSSRPSADALARPSEDGGPSVGHGYKNVMGQGTVTTPCRRPLLRTVRPGGDR